MARKKQEVALQLEVNSQEEWEELMQKEGLIVVDVFQDWCGPCKAVLSFFRRIKNEIGDDFLLFATAKCDTIDSLDKYRSRCEPCFLIYGGGCLVSVIRGANPPLLEETIKNKLQDEHKVMKGEIERKEIKDPYLAGIDVEEKVETTEKDVEEIEQEVTLALIKPDVVKAGKVDEIIEKLRERGIEILAQQERNLTEDEAKSFYHHMEDSEHFESLIKFITSGPSYVLVLTKGDQGIIHEFRELIGPKLVEEAKETSPESFRAIYGTSSIENAIHGADDKDSAIRELAFFFPDFVVPKIARKKQEVSNQQRTLALIRPAAFAEFKTNILEKIEAAGFQISMQKEVKLTKEEAELFYKEHAGQPYFEELTTEMSKGTLLALALEKQNAISGFRGILGPKDVEKAKENDPSSLRAQFSREDIAINLIHGSDSEETAQNELKYFFPVEQTVAAIKPDGVENREEIMNKIIEARFKIVKTLDIVMTKELAEEFYQDQKDEEYFDDLITHMQSGPTLFMVLSREDAIRGWRSIMGPKNPDIASEAYPDSIRSIFGKDIKENAVYGSADEDEVKRVMNLIFGKLEFFEDGTLLPEYADKEEEGAADIEVETHEDQDPKDSADQDNQQDATDAPTDDQVKDPEDQEMVTENQETGAEGQEEISATDKGSEEPELAEHSITEEKQEETEPTAATESEQVEVKESTAEEAQETKDETLNETEEQTGESTERAVDDSKISEEKQEVVETEPTDKDVEPVPQGHNDEWDADLGGPVASAMNPNQEEIALEKSDETVIEDNSHEATNVEDESDLHTRNDEENVTVAEDTVVEHQDETVTEKTENSKEQESTEKVDDTVTSVEQENVAVTSEKEDGVTSSEKDVVVASSEKEEAVETSKEEDVVVSPEKEEVVETSKEEDVVVSPEKEEVVESSEKEEVTVSEETKAEDITKDSEKPEETVVESNENVVSTQEVANNEKTEDSAVVETMQPDDTYNAGTDPVADTSVADNE